jgi:hypothetical protein
VHALSHAQHELLEAWFPEAAVVRDLSWGLVGTVVLEINHEGNRYVKAGDAEDQHLKREIHAHGGGTRSARRSELPSGRFRSATRASSSRATG